MEPTMAGNHEGMAASRRRAQGTRVRI